MDFRNLIGLIGHSDDQVSEKSTAISLNTGALPVYATPAMGILMERAACAAIQNHLPLGTTTLGASLNIKHITATPMGHHVSAEARVTEVEGRRLTFKIKVFDEKGKIGEASHERFVIDAESFMQKIKNRGPAS